MTWLQDTQQSLREKMSWAEDFNSHMLLRWGFRNWLKVGLHHHGEMLPRELATATLSCNHTVPVQSPVAQSLQSYAISPFQQHYSLFQRPSLSFSLSSTQNFLLHTASLPCTVSLCSLLMFFHSCAQYSSLPQSQHCFIYWARVWEGKDEKKPFSSVSLSSSPVQGLSLYSGGDSNNLPHSLPHEEVLLGMV